MAVIIGVARESAPGERRVALTPETAKKLVAAGAVVHAQRGLGALARFPDQAYADAGAELVDGDVLSGADVVLCVQSPPAAAIATMKQGAVLVGALHPQADEARAAAIRERGVVAFPLERLPRTTRAQAMDILSSQAGMAGYKAVLIAAQLAPRFFPMLTTAAGTIRPSKVLVVGAGVAGLQAVATARRLGAQVECFDVRPETREQIESLGGKFLDLGVSAAGEGGYARPLTDEERALQQQRLAEHLKGIDAIVSTAAVPGRPAPKIISAAMVDGMKPGSVIVDLAAETGGNCELTRRGETFETGNGVVVAGPVDLASMGALHASEMFARNLYNFVSLLLREDGLAFDWDDELLAKTVWPERAAAPA
ncbi:NAD(P) transhydrogenase subunit alpha [Luteimonas wenzhouensis]|jgi:NAD(P) transhydrogenase subunit alpha|uniref:proton-translocating NAD(P)(+) transhydrogenase n=1 Tax=Luteimonas wenzhouensis TaxID=2599615 RepID=A0A5C5U7A8_9GAMM|nr:NAD(P) transhydrogenase subunit alpha [Luteimonas wenzhouensis]NLW95409.1 NAD(P) transhydrogenase subunit alpha [Xanthomonadaceae bacterium]TWT21944.1 NAD(P) transhydrogenase subunit alpha [Luteimonas wenzhouensis]